MREDGPSDLDAARTESPDRLWHDPDLAVTALHFSVRIDGFYVNPVFLMGCFSH